MEENRKTKGLSSISNVITPMAKKMLGKRGFVEVDIIVNWDKIVGDELAEFTVPQKIDFRKDQRSEGTLHIQAITGAFALELQHREKFIIEKINSYFGYNAVSKIKISQDSGQYQKKTETLFDNKELQNSKKSLVSKEEEIYISEMTKDLTNQKLKEILTTLGNDVITQNKKREEE